MLTVHLHSNYTEILQLLIDYDQLMNIPHISVDQRSIRHLPM